jgi:hypothetical protein
LTAASRVKRSAVEREGDASRRVFGNADNACVELYEM